MIVDEQFDVRMRAFLWRLSLNIVLLRKHQRAESTTLIGQPYAKREDQVDDICLFDVEMSFMTFF